jgi:hypothetical protein
LGAGNNSFLAISLDEKLEKGVSHLQLTLFHGIPEKLFRTLVDATVGVSAKVFLFALLCSICCSFCVSPSLSAEPLKAGIEFSDSLAPLQSGLREGQRMNLGAVETGKRNITEWRRIPNWFAGIWHKEKSTRFVNGRPVSYQTRADLITGYQMDAKGRIWQPVFVNVGKVETDDYVEYQMPQRKTIYAMEKGKYTSFSLSTRVRIDKDTNQIMSSFQQEDLSVSTPQSDGVVKAVVECRVFNQDGRVKFEDTIEVMEVRVEEFNPIDEYNGIDYRDSFIKFLEASGHPELIPAERPKSVLTETQERILSIETRNNRMQVFKRTGGEPDGAPNESPDEFPPQQQRTGFQPSQRPQSQRLQLQQKFQQLQQQLQQLQQPYQPQRPESKRMPDSGF